jgi:hypothetical protein
LQCGSGNGLSSLATLAALAALFTVTCVTRFRPRKAYVVFRGGGSLSEQMRSFLAIGPPKSLALLVLLLISPIDGLRVQGRSPKPLLGKSPHDKLVRSLSMMAMPNPNYFAYGDSDFVTIRKDRQFFRDNTKCISALEREPRFCLFTRPTRWGKTLLLKMLSMYYDENTTRKTFDELFRGLYVYDYPTELKGKYQVLCLNFIGTAGTSADERTKSLWKHINAECKKFAQKYGYALVINEDDAMSTIVRLGEAVKARRDSHSTFWGKLRRPWRSSPPQLYIFIDEYDRYVYELLGIASDPDTANVEPGDKARAELASGLPLVTVLNQLKSMSDCNLVGRCLIVGLCRTRFADGTDANMIKMSSAEGSLADACGFGLEDIKVGLEYLKLNENQTAEALKIMKACFNGYRFPGVGNGTDDGRYNAQLCVNFFRKLCDKENMRFLDPSDDEHWEKLDLAKLTMKCDDENSQPSSKMLELLARYSWAMTDLSMLASGKTLKHDEDRLTQRYSLRSLMDPSNPECIPTARDFMYDMGFVTRGDSPNELKVPNSVVRGLMAKQGIYAAKEAKDSKIKKANEKKQKDFKEFFDYGKGIVDTGKGMI